MGLEAHDPEFKTRAGIKSQALNQPSHPGASGPFHLLRVTLFVGKNNNLTTWQQILEKMFLHDAAATPSELLQGFFGALSSIFSTGKHTLHSVSHEQGGCYTLLLHLTAERKPLPCGLLVS